MPTRMHAGKIYNYREVTPRQDQAHAFKQACAKKTPFCKRNGVKEISWHILRHTFASQLVAEGIPLPAVKELLGHSSINMTMRYAHLAPSILGDAVNILQRAEDREMKKYGHSIGTTNEDPAGNIESSNDPDNDIPAQP